jgi:hypothetical protein
MTVPTWANAGPQHNRGKVAAAIKKDLMEHSPIRAEAFTPRAAAGTAVSEPAEAMTFIFIAVDRV